MAFKIFALIKRLMRESKTIMSVYISVLWGLYFKFYKGIQNQYGVLCAFFNVIAPMCRSPPGNLIYEIQIFKEVLLWIKSLKEEDIKTILMI